MSRARLIAAATLTASALVVGGFAAIPTEGNAGVSATLTPLERIQLAHAVVADLNPALLASSRGQAATRTILISHHTDTTAPLLLRRPGL
jgi:hypothetical protein